jgi:hypothetical protein
LKWRYNDFLSFLDTNNPPPIIQWSFDGNLNDTFGMYNGISTNGIVQWLTPDHAGSGSFAFFANQTFSLIPFILKLTATSFTVSAWIMLPLSTVWNSSEVGLFAHCEITSADKCLHLTVRDGYLRLGFYGDDLLANTFLNNSIWYHAAFVYDRVIGTQSIYLNGQLDGTRSPIGAYQGNANSMVIGIRPFVGGTSPIDNYIDQMILVPRVKNESELLDDATLVAYYSFDNVLLDSSANQMNKISETNLMFDIDGRVNQALLINQFSAYFQTEGFYFLGQSNYSYSFSLWIYPFAAYGTIIQVICLIDKKNRLSFENRSMGPFPYGVCLYSVSTMEVF